MSAEAARVGIVVPALDVAPWLGAMLESIRRQTLRSWVAVVVDDGSTDATVAVATAHAAVDPRISVARNPEEGIGARLARARGRELVGSGPAYLCFPDADDILDPAYLETLVAFLDRHPTAVAAYARIVGIDEEGRPNPIGGSPVRCVLTLRWVGSSRPELPVSFESIYVGAGAGEGTTLVRAAAFDAVGGWRAAPPRRSGTGTDLLLRLRLRGDVYFVPDAVYAYRRRAGQGSEDTTMLRDDYEALKQEWRSRAASDPRLETLVASADFLASHRLVPARAFEQAGRHLLAGRPLAAARNLIGGARRYRWSLPPGVDPTTGPDPLELRFRSARAPRPA